MKNPKMKTERVYLKPKGEQLFYNIENWLKLFEPNKLSEFVPSRRFFQFLLYSVKNFKNED